MNWFQKIIINLYEKYCLNDLLDNEKKEFMKKYDLKDDDEYNEFCIDMTREPLKQAYEAGKEYVMCVRSAGRI